MALKHLMKSPREVLDRLTKAREAVVTEIERHNGSKPEITDLPALEGWREQRSKLDARLKDADAAIAFQRSVVEEAERAEQAEKDRARHAAAQRAAVAGEKRVRAIAQILEAVVPELEWLQAHRQEIAATNTELGQRFGRIEDAESRVRRKPGRHVPEQFEMRDVWRNSAGDTPGAFVRDASGELVPMHPGYTKRQERVVLAPAKDAPPVVPKSLTEAVVLPGLVGGDDPIWPPRRA
jgi:uncharacterized protein YhaN